MDAGIISSRYATALYRYAVEQDCQDSVYEESGRLEEALRTKPLRDALHDTGVSPVLDRFIRLVATKGRLAFLPMMLKDFGTKYRREKGILPATLTTASPASRELLSSLRALVKQRTGMDAQITAVVDPALIGGFVFDLGDEILDASVSSQLEKIRRAFIDKNRRIV